MHLAIHRERPCGCSFWIGKSTAKNHFGQFPLISREATLIPTFPNFRFKPKIRGNEGKTLATYDFHTNLNSNIVTPTVLGNRVILTSRHNLSKVFFLEITKNGIEQILVSHKGNSEVACPVCWQNRLYLPAGTLKCLDLSTGEVIWRGDKFGIEGTLLMTADEKLLVAGKSKLALYNLDGEKLAEKTDVPTGWPNVVFADGRIYCKTCEGDIRCYEPIKLQKFESSSLELQHDIQ